MDILADTNIIVRRINSYDAKHKEARTVLKILEERGHRLCIVPQNIIECWNVGTRPIDRNGLGLLPSHMERISARIEDAFHMLRKGLRSFPSGKGSLRRIQCRG